MNFTIEIEQEDDGRIIAEIPDLPGVLVYGKSRDQAIALAKALALRVLADRLEHGESVPMTPCPFLPWELDSVQLIYQE
jgi:predicted RNase H-like HicB family nuclease